MSAGAAKVARPKVTAVVLNWNGLDDTLACLRSLAASEMPLSVIVVDNGSLLSPESAIEEAMPGAEFIGNPCNEGYAAGNNVGIRRAMDSGADFVWVLNNDAMVEPDTLGHLLAAAESHPKAGAIGPKVLYADRPDTLWVAWGTVTWRQSLVGLVGEGARDERRWTVERAVEWIPGCSLLLRSAALAEVGLFDEDFFAYHEDVDWAARARSLGWSSWYTGAARVYHGVHGSSGGSAHYGGFRKYLSARNMVLYARKHGSPVRVLAMALAVVATFPAQLLRRALRGEAGGVWIKARGWWDGILRRPIPFADLGLR